MKSKTALTVILVFGILMVFLMSTVAQPTVDAQSNIDFGWPVGDPRVTQWYSTNHRAIDIISASGNTPGTPVLAAADGTISFRGWVDGSTGPGCENNSNPSGGNGIVISHDNSAYRTGYYHLQGFAPGLSVGNTIKRGELIGFIGNTGCVAGSGGGHHLHFVTGTTHNSNGVIPDEHSFNPFNHGYLPHFAIVVPRGSPPHYLKIDPPDPAINTKPRFTFTLRNMTPNPITISELFVRTYKPDGSAVHVGGNTGSVAPNATINITANQAGNYTDRGAWRLHKVEIKDNPGNWLNGIPLGIPYYVGSPNLAAGRPITVSSHDGSNTGPRAADKNWYTRWASASGQSQPWINVDLGSNKIVDTMIIRWENAYPGQFWIDTKASTGGWQYLGTYPGTFGDHHIRFSERNIRYIRVTVERLHDRYSNVSLWEYEVYDR